MSGFVVDGSTFIYYQDIQDNGDTFSYSYSPDGYLNSILFIRDREKRIGGFAGIYGFGKNIVYYSFSLYNIPDINPDSDPIIVAFPNVLSLGAEGLNKQLRELFGEFLIERLGTQKTA